MDRDIWLQEDTLSELVDRDRLCPVLVRYRGQTEGRFTAPAQDVPRLIDILERTGHYVRDVSVQVQAPVSALPDCFLGGANGEDM